MKKGFTLVELLAVIVILAIIALITVPIIMNVVESSRKSSATSSAYGYIKGVNITYANELLLGNNFELEGTLLVDESGNIDGHKVDVEGTTIKGGYLTYNDGKVTGCLTIGDYKVSIENDSVTETIKGKCDGAPKAKSFAEDSWDTIIANVKAGTDAYKVGDTKEVTLTSDDEEIAGTYTLRIANTSTPSECSQEDFSQTACGFVVEFEDIITKYNMNSTLTSENGWEASEMRKYLNVINGEEGSGTIYNALPEELKVGIKDTKVISGYEKNATANYITIDKLYLLSPHEVWENGTEKTLDDDTTYDKTRQLDYYKGVTIDNYTGAIKNYNGSAFWWWYRGAYPYGNNNFYFVGKDGDWGNYIATGVGGVSPAFRIG